MWYRIVWHGFVPTLAFVFHFSFLLCKFRVRMSFALLHGFATSFSIILCHGSHLLALIVAHRSSFWCVFGPSIFISCLRNYVYYYIIIVIIIFLYCYYVHTPSTAIFGGRNTKHTYAYHRTNEKNALSLKHSTYMNICVHHRILYNKNWHREYINAGSISYTNLIQWQQQTTTF